MKQIKSLLQRMQSRIAKRRNYIYDLEYTLASYLDAGEGYISRVHQLKSEIKEEADSQQLDKKLMSMLLEKERLSNGAYFRKKYFYPSLARYMAVGGA